MIKTDADSLLREVRAAEKLRDARLKHVPDMLSRYHGPFYDDTESGSDGENFFYEYITWTIPQLVFSNPRVRVGSRRGESQSVVADAIQYGLNRWVRDVDLRRKLLPTAVDMLLSWGILMVTEEANDNIRKGSMPKGLRQQAATPRWPAIARVPGDFFFRDPAAHSLFDARYEGHMWIRDKSSVLEDARKNPKAGWIIENIEHLAYSSDNVRMKRQKKDVPDREEILGYDIWIPEIELEDSPGTDEGFHGTIYTIAVDAATDPLGKERTGMIREPRPFYGPRWGPYIQYGVHPVPNDSYPLSPLLAVSMQVEELNRHDRSMSESAARYKRVLLYDQADVKTAQDLRDATHDHFVGVRGLDKERIIPAEIGGITDQQITFKQMLKERLDRVSGFGDAQRGIVQGRGTATEATIADANADVRIAFTKQQFQGAVERTLQTVAWYMYHDDQIVFPLGQEAAQVFEDPDPWFVGGQHGGESGASFDDLELEIEAYSMERSDEGLNQRRRLQAFQMVLAIAPIAAQTPWIDWAELLDMTGDALNLPELGALFKADVAAEAMGQMQQDEEPPPGSEPRLSKDVGQMGSQGSQGGQGAGQFAQLLGSLPGLESGAEAGQAVKFG